METKLKEKDIVDHIVKNFETYFPDLKFYKKEFSFRNFRVDIASSLQVDLKDLKIREESYKMNAPIFFEVKYNSEMRDLIFELEKQIAFRDFYINCNKSFAMICVISDKFDNTMVKYMSKNNILMFKIDIDNDDLETLEINELILNEIDIKDIDLGGE